MKKRLLTILGMMVLALTLIVGMTACGSSEEAEAPPEPEPVFNPLTGEEVESVQDMPVRPVIVSIDNVGDAVPQSNLSYADMIYEFPVEGLQTRLEAVFYTKHPEFVGPVRSTRPYFVDLTREYQGVFVAYGWSPDAKKYLHEKHVPWINGMVHTDLFYRVHDKAAPHNAYIKWEEIEKHASKSGDWFSEDKRKEIRPFRFAGVNEEQADKALADEIAELEAEKQAEEQAEEGATTEETTVAETQASETTETQAEEKKEPVKPKLCDAVKFDYSYSHCSFEYDAEKGNYKRFVKGSPYIDKESEKQIKCKNIIVQKVSSKVLDAKGRLDIDMCKGGKALLFTDGKVIKGTWTRSDLDHRTVFMDKNGEQFTLTPGKTWVEVVDQNCKVSYDAKEMPEETEAADESAETEAE